MTEHCKVLVRVTCANYACKKSATVTADLSVTMEHEISVSPDYPEGWRFTFAFLGVCCSACFLEGEAKLAARKSRV